MTAPAGVIDMDDLSFTLDEDDEESIEHEVANAPAEEPEKLTPTGRKPRADKGVPRGPRSSTRTSGGPGPGRPKGSRSSATTDKAIAQGLVELFALLGTAAQFSMPTVGQVLIQRGEPTADALVRAAQGKPRMLAALRKMGSVGPASELLQTVAMVAVAVQLDTGRIPPNHPMAVVTGTGELWLNAHPEPQQGPGEQYVAPGGGGFNVEPPPGFGPDTFGMGDPANPFYSFRAAPGAALLNVGAPPL